MIVALNILLHLVCRYTTLWNWSIFHEVKAYKNDAVLGHSVYRVERPTKMRYCFCDIENKILFVAWNLQ